jgi:hypothetical protein
VATEPSTSVDLPEVGLGEITIDLLEARFWTASVLRKLALVNECTQDFSTTTPVLFPDRQTS